VITRAMAGMTVVAPADPAQLRALVKASVDVEGPVYFRTGRGREPQVYGPEQAAHARIGNAVVHGYGRDVTLVATGTMVHPALEAAALLAAQGVHAGVVDMHTVKPLDVDVVAEATERSRLLVSVEEHNVVGASVVPSEQGSSKTARSRRRPAQSSPDLDDIRPPYECRTSRR
jgi:transketolase